MTEKLTPPAADAEIAPPAEPTRLHRLRPYLLGAGIGILIADTLGAVGWLQPGTTSSLCIVAWVISAPASHDVRPRTGWIGAYERFCSRHEKALLTGLAVVVGALIVSALYWSVMARLV